MPKWCKNGVEKSKVHRRKKSHCNQKIGLQL